MARLTILLLALITLGQSVTLKSGQSYSIDFTGDAGLQAAKVQALSLTSNVDVDVNIATNLTSPAPAATDKGYITIGSTKAGVAGARPQESTEQYLKAFPSAAVFASLVIDTQGQASSFSLKVSFASASENPTTNKVQLLLLQGTADAGSNIFYGATAYSNGPSDTTFSWTATNGSNVQSNTFFFATLQLDSVTNTGSPGGTSKGSTMFNYDKYFWPVSFGNLFNILGGYQYAFGQNIYVTPFSGGRDENRGLFIIEYAGILSRVNSSTSNSLRPSDAVNTGGVWKHYYYFNGTTPTGNVIQWTSQRGDGADWDIVDSPKYDGVNTNVTSWTSKPKLTWHRAPAGGKSDVIGSTAWSSVPSRSAFDAQSGRVTVWCAVNSYSQWAVGGDAAGLSVAMGTVVMMVLLAIVF